MSDHLAAGGLRFSLVDVFADEPLAGNPLAVVAEAENVDDRTLAAIAREFNQSETTFVLRPTKLGADWRLRSFTSAGVEVFGAGHNALGAWWWLADAGHLALPSRSVVFRQELGDAVLPVEVTADSGRPERVVLTQGPSAFGETCEDLAALAAALGLAADDLRTRDLPAQVVSTGTPHLLVPARDQPAVRRARPDSGALARLLHSVGAQGCYLYCLDPIADDAAAYARFFGPIAGIPEDPATGSAAGPLAYLLTQHGVSAAGTWVAVEQGHAVQRPSRIHVRADSDATQIAGHCITVADGTLHLR